MDKKTEKQFAINKHRNNTNWKQYLDDLHQYLTELGFTKYNQNLKREDFAYWKNMMTNIE